MAEPPGNHMTIPCRVLMIYPKCVPNSFWNYAEACELVGARYLAAGVFCNLASGHRAEHT